MTKTEERKLFNLFLRKIKEKYRPDGKTDNGGRWFPSESESCSCCENVRSPSRAYPWSLYKHCHSIKHIKNVLSIRKVESIEDLPLLIEDNDYIGEIAKEILKT